MGDLFTKLRAAVAEETEVHQELEHIDMGIEDSERTGLLVEHYDGRHALRFACVRAVLQVARAMAVQTLSTKRAEIAKIAAKIAAGETHDREDHGGEYLLATLEHITEGDRPGWYWKRENDGDAGVPWGPFPSRGEAAAGAARAGYHASVEVRYLSSEVNVLGEFYADTGWYIVHGDGCREGPYPRDEAIHVAEAAGFHVIVMAPQEQCAADGCGRDAVGPDPELRSRYCDKHQGHVPGQEHAEES